MPGVGVVTALTIIAEVGDFTRFASAKHISSFSGLIPRQRSSGESVRFGSITNQGSRTLRMIMVEAAFRIRPTNAPELYAFVARDSRRYAARNARALLLLERCSASFGAWAKTKTPYDKTKVIVHFPRIANVSHIDTYRGA
jgi:transposase